MVIVSEYKGQVAPVAKGVWQKDEEYKKLNIVKTDEGLFICKLGHTALSKPKLSDDEFWECLIDFKTNISADNANTLEGFSASEFAKSQDIEKINLALQTLATMSDVDKKLSDEYYTKVKSDELYPTKEDLKELETKISKVFTYKGSVESLDALNQISEKTIGDTYSIGSDNYTWDGDKWNKLGGSVDLSSYATIDLLNSKLSTKADSGVSYTKAEVYSKTETNNLLNSKANNGVSYTKAETNNLLATKMQNGTSFTKAESEARYALKSVVGSGVNDLQIRQNKLEFVEHLNGQTKRINFSSAFSKKCFGLFVLYSESQEQMSFNHFKHISTYDKAGFSVPIGKESGNKIARYYLIYIAFGY